MHKSIYLMGLLALGAPALACAAEGEPLVKLGIEGYREHYEETVEGSRFMEEKAYMYGLTGALRMDVSEQGALSLEGRFVRGNADYNSDSGSYSGLSRRSHDLRLVYQYALTARGLRFVPEFGIGVRELTDNLQESGPGGYRRESTYRYATVGVRSLHELGDGWRLEPKLSYNHLLEGEQVSRLRDVDSNFSDLTNRQTKGYGFELSASFVRAVDAGKAISITPFWRGWRIDDSNVQPIRYAGVQVGEGMEPKNETDEVGLSLAYHF